jgi:hypothetical protein
MGAYCRAHGVAREHQQGSEKARAIFAGRFYAARKIGCARAKGEGIIGFESRIRKTQEVIHGVSP